MLSRGARVRRVRRSSASSGAGSIGCCAMQTIGWNAKPPLVGRSATEPRVWRLRLRHAPLGEVNARGAGGSVSRSLPNRAMHAVFSRVNSKRYWHEMPFTPLKALNLLSLRLDLRDMNLFDADRKTRQGPEHEPPPEAAKARRPDGKWNDLRDPDMGPRARSSAATSTRKYKPEKPPRLYDPNPREVSLELMTRDTFKPAETSTSWPPPGSSSRTTTGSSTAAARRTRSWRSPPRGRRLADRPDVRAPHGLDPAHQADPAAAASANGSGVSTATPRRTGGTVADLRHEQGGPGRDAPFRTAS